MSAVIDTGSAGTAPMLRQRWQALSARDRKALTLMAVLLGLLLTWLLAVRPAWQTVRAAPAQLALVEVQLQQMQRLADEARSLRGAAPVSPMQAAAALRAATERLGAGARINVQGDRATLTLTGTPTEALRGWLAEARSAARARPIEVQLTRGATGFSGSVVVSTGAGS